MRRVIGIVILGLAAALPAAAQDDIVQDDIVTVEAPAAADTIASDSTVVALPATVDPEPVNMWDTGVSATGAVVMTPLFPGWGQLYAENSWRGALGFGVQMYFWTNMLSRDRQAVRARDFANTFDPDDPNYDWYNA